VREPEPLNSSEGRYGRLIERFGKWRKPICKWLRSRESVPFGDVDDLAQEVFLRLTLHSDDVAMDNPRRYLLRIAADVVNEWRRKSPARTPHDDSWLEGSKIESVDDPDNALARSLATAYVQAVVDRLPARQREVMVLHVNEGLTCKQIAAQRGLPYRIVVRDVTRAYASLRMKLQPEEV
jgi:RNA polymerase sigma factor (sigma-70 family)